MKLSDRGSMHGQQGMTSNGRLKRAHAMSDDEQRDLFKVPKEEEKNLKVKRGQPETLVCSRALSLGARGKCRETSGLTESGIHGWRVMQPLVSDHGPVKNGPGINALSQRKSKMDPSTRTRAASNTGPIHSRNHSGILRRLRRP
jgi:hypothetical protein